MTVITEDLRPFAEQLYGWGANVTAIKSGTKRPAHKWKALQHRRQTRQEFERLPWDGYTSKDGEHVAIGAVGIVNGPGGFRVLDIDAEKDDGGFARYVVPESILHTALDALKLPLGYQWAGRSGGITRAGENAGWRIVVRCDEELPQGGLLEKEDEPGVYEARPKNGLHYDHVELRWSSGQTVMEGEHPSGGRYGWQFKPRPFVEPARITAKRVIAGLSAIADLSAGKPDASPREPIKTARGGASAYGTAALNDAIRQVSTCPNGNRNNILFEQSASLFELANGGELAGHEVETGMLGAALAAGLKEGESKATIASARKAAAGKKRAAPEPTTAGAQRNGTYGAPGEEGGDQALRAAVDEATDSTLGLRPMPLTELLAQEFPPLEFLVEEMVAKGHLAMLGGRPKSGKSWLMLQMAQAIDEGRQFLGRNTAPAKVLIVALEDGARRVYQRANILRWQPKQAHVVFDVAHFDGDGLEVGPGLKQIAANAPDFDVIIIDTLIATLSGRANENDNAQMGQVINELARIAHTTDTAILLVHHTGKGQSENVFDLLRGASALRGGYDVGMLLERKQDEREAILHIESRDVDLSNMTIRQSPNGAGWECLGNGAVLSELRAGRKVVKVMLASGDGQTAEDLGKLLGVTRQAAHAQLTNAEKHGYVYRKPEENPDAQKPADLWFLTDYVRGASS